MAVFIQSCRHNNFDRESFISNVVLLTELKRTLSKNATSAKYPVTYEELSVSKGSRSFPKWSDNSLFLLMFDLLPVNLESNEDKTFSIIRKSSKSNCELDNPADWMSGLVVILGYSLLQSFLVQFLYEIIVCF